MRLLNYVLQKESEVAELERRHKRCLDAVQQQVIEGKRQVVLNS